MQKGFKAGLQCDMNNITHLKIFLTYTKKTKNMASDPITPWQIQGKKWKQ